MIIIYKITDKDDFDSTGYCQMNMVMINIILTMVMIVIYVNGAIIIVTNTYIKVYIN